MHIQDCLEEILHLEDTELAACLAGASRLFSCKKGQLVAKSANSCDWTPFLVSGVIRGYLTDEKGVQKVTNALARLGHSYSDIRQVLREYEIDGDW